VNAREFFEKNLTEQALLIELDPANEDAILEKLDWALNLWSAERIREDAIRWKSERFLNIHILVASAIASATVAGSIFSGIQDFMGGRVTTMLLSATGTFVLLSWLVGVWYGLKVAQIRMHHVLDPSLALRVKGPAKEWARHALAHVLITYKKNLKLVSEMAFYARLTRDWLYLLVFIGIVGSAASWATRVPEAPLIMGRPLFVGVVFGGVFWGLWCWILVFHPRPHS
jgi:hypothetical protein